MVQLKPSIKREISGRAVVVKIACCVVAGACTWSKVKICFLPEAADEVDAAAAVLEPTDEGVVDTASTDTLVGEMALMTVLWKRAGMEVESWLVGGRIRRAAVTRGERSTLFEIVVRILTNLNGGRRAVRRRRRRHVNNVHGTLGISSTTWTLKDVWEVLKKTRSRISNPAD